MATKPTDASKGLEYFDEARSAEVVNARMSPDIDPRTHEIMTVVVNYLHAAVKELKLTNEEWFKAIQFLTEVGQKCNEWRQEYILLSDILGVSMLVDAINSHRPDGSTENTVLGPFYVPDAPRHPNGTNICLDGKGEPLVVRGRVLDQQRRPISGAVIDVWQTNDDGFYDVQQKGILPDWNLRGVFHSDKDGTYWFRSVKPPFYPIPDDGPAGQLLRAIGRHPNRAAHVHFIVQAPGYETVVTHIFTPDCQFLDEDAVFGVKKSLIADFKRVDDPAEAKLLGFSNPFWSVAWDFVLVPKSDQKVSK